MNNYDRRRWLSRVVFHRFGIHDYAIVNSKGVRRCLWCGKPK